MEGRVINQVLVDNGAAINILSANIMIKLNKDDHDLIPVGDGQ